MIAKLLIALTMALSAIGTPGADADVFQIGDHYLMVGSDGYLTMWAESNGSPGLQSSPVIIMGAVIVEADRKVHA